MENKTTCWFEWRENLHFTGIWFSELNRYFWDSMWFSPTTVVCIAVWFWNWQFALCTSQCYDIFTFTNVIINSNKWSDDLKQWRDTVCGRWETLFLCVNASRDVQLWNQTSFEAWLHIHYVIMFSLNPLGITCSPVKAWNKGVAQLMPWL